MAYALWHTVVSGAAELSISLDAFLLQFVSVIYWVKHVAYFVLPHGVVNGLFGLAVFVYFPIRIVASAIIGWWALNKAGQLAEAENQQKPI